MTARALDIFNQVDLIAAEDTRHSGLLLNHYGIKKPFFALHDHNEQQKRICWWKNCVKATILF